MSLIEDCTLTLMHAIQDRTFPPGTKMPSEADLALQLDVSRATLREALRTLEERQLIVRRHGVGTFVADMPINKDLHRNSGITSMIRAAGYSPGTADDELSVVPADSEIAGALDIPEGTEVVRLSRIRLADKRPVVMSTDFISRRIMHESELEGLSERSPSLYALLYQRRGITIYRAQADLVPVRATPPMSERLGVARGAPILCIKQIDFDDAGRPVVYSVEYHVSDWIRFTVERLGPGSAIDI